MDAMTLARIQLSRTASTRGACPLARAPSTPALVPTPCLHHRQLAWTASHRARTVTTAATSASSSSGDSAQPPSSLPSIDNRSVLFKYVTEVEPSVVDSFERTGPPHVVDAVKATVTSLLGTLPPQFFEVNVVTLGDNLRSLMYSFLMTGYLYRHVVDHLELKQGMDRALPGSVLQDNVPQDVKPGRRYGTRSQALDGYAEGTNKSDISGLVTRWNYQTGPETVAAGDYIDMLEKEIQILKEQTASDDNEDDSDRNELLAYLRKQPSASIHGLRAGQEVSDAMDMFLQRLLGTDDARELNTVTSETSATELQRLLSWLMIVGYTLRSMEVRFSMEQTYALPYVALDVRDAEDKGLRDNL